MNYGPDNGGRLVLIVGPSGAGKDTLLDIAKRELAEDKRIRFVQRTITRPASVGEDHLPMDEASFEEAAAQGAFALHWAAHDLQYGLPVVIDRWIADGDVVVANASRAMLGPARQRYPGLMIINITADPEILAKRLAQRGREDSDAQKSRLGRSKAISPDLGDVVIIDNSGDLDVASRQLMALIQSVRAERPDQGRN